MALREKRRKKRVRGLALREKKKGISGKAKSKITMGKYP